MVFSSLIFLWCFLPIVFILNFILHSCNIKLANVFLILASLLFYAWGETTLVLLMLASILANWLIGYVIGFKSKHRQIWLIGGIVFNLGILGYYKYAGFLLEIVNSIFGCELQFMKESHLPIGISFFTFQAISYIVDVYRKDVTASKNITNVALYISFFPQLVAGPIVKYKDINSQIENRTINADKIASGFRKFIYGLGKKVLIANILGQTVDRIYDMSSMEVSGTMIWIAAIMYTFQIYYDFSGYSDMAVGLAKMFGFSIRDNFHYPYMSSSVSEFWRRWHISLGAWFREYVYIPLGGNRRGAKRTYFNLLVVFFLTGLWHGANYTFLMWGMMYGILACLEKGIWGRVLQKSKLLSGIYMGVVTVVGWVIFRSATITDALRYVKRMVLPWKYTQYNIPYWKYLNMQTICIAILAFFGMGIIQWMVPEKMKEKWCYSAGDVIFCMLVLIGSIAALASATYNPFIYFQF